MRMYALTSYAQIGNIESRLLYCLCVFHIVVLILQLLIQVVLDLDETLVCAYETSSLPAVFRAQATEAGLNWFELECVSSDKVPLAFSL